jgi:hypothetical protein
MVEFRDEGDGSPYKAEIVLTGIEKNVFAGLARVASEQAVVKGIEIDACLPITDDKKRHKLIDLQNTCEAIAKNTKALANPATPDEEFDQSKKTPGRMEAAEFILHVLVRNQLGVQVPEIAKALKENPGIWDTLEKIRPDVTKSIPGYMTSEEREELRQFALQLTQKAPHFSLRSDNLAQSVAFNANTLADPGAEPDFKNIAVRFFLQHKGSGFGQEAGIADFLKKNASVRKEIAHLSELYTSNEMRAESRRRPGVPIQPRTTLERAGENLDAGQRQR